MRAFLKGHEIPLKQYQLMGSTDTMVIILPALSLLVSPSFFFFKDFIYLFMRDAEGERQAETQAEGEAGSMQGARHGTRSWDPRVTPWAEGGTKPLSPPAALLL